MAHEWEDVLSPASRAAASATLRGRLPDSHPVVVDMSAAEREVSYGPVTDYRSGVGAACEWLVEATRDKDWHDVLPSHARYNGELFDTPPRKLACRA